MWKIEKFRVFTGANLKTKFSKVPCVSQIECQSNKINQYNDDYYSRHTCWISFVDGVPPANVCYPVDYGNLTPPTTAAFGSELNLKQNQHSLADYISILTSMETYLSVDPGAPELTQLIATPIIDKIPPQVISSDPPNGAINVPTNKVIKITFNEPIEQANDYDNILVTRPGTRYGRIIPTNNSIIGNVLTITPISGTFENGFKFTVTLPANSVQDLAGNAILQTYTTTFNTATI